MSYEPHPNDRKVAGALDSLIQDIMSGNLVALGVCGYRSNGDPVYFFFDKTPPDRATLNPVINKMVTLYQQRAAFTGNAPENNRSNAKH